MNTGGENHYSISWKLMYFEWMFQEHPKTLSYFIGKNNHEMDEEWNKKILSEQRHII